MTDKPKILRLKPKGERKTIGVASLIIPNPRDVLSRYAVSKGMKYDGSLGVDGVVIIPVDDGPSNYGLLALGVSKNDAIYALDDIAKFASCRNMPV